MLKLLLAMLLNLSFLASDAAFLKDTTFISYKEFARLSKEEVKQQFGRDDASRKIISDHYKHKRKAWKMLWGIIPLTAIGTYFGKVSADATNGMGSVVGIVLSILCLLSASILLIALIVSLSAEKENSKILLYEKLKRYFES